jgi:hypothetical protein
MDIKGVLKSIDSIFSFGTPFNGINVDDKESICFSKHSFLRLRQSIIVKYVTSGLLGTFDNLQWT